jgi:murein DD-endopeptidase MepM/ murein hydrolase activator NlpD
MRPSRTPPRSAVAILLLALALLAPSTHAWADAAPPPFSDPVEPAWTWPLAGFRLERAFEAPAHRYGAGHRGIDLRADPNAAVRAPAAGTVAFSGSVAGRGILTIDHGGGLVTTFEPVASDAVPGAVVAPGENVATLSLGGHTSPGTLHFGVRLDGEYINPMLLLGDVPRAVLLPCC